MKEAFWYILCKIVALATWNDMEDIGGIGQLCSGL